MKPIGEWVREQMTEYWGGGVRGVGGLYGGLIHKFYGDDGPIVFEDYEDPSGETDED